MLSQDPKLSHAIVTPMPQVHVFAMLVLWTVENEENRHGGLQWLSF
jgi:hypothetical protein